MLKKLKFRLAVWNVWKKKSYCRTKWQKFCVLLGLRHSPSFEIEMSMAKALKTL